MKSTLLRAWTWIREHVAVLSGVLLFCVSALLLWQRFRGQLQTLTDAFALLKLQTSVRDLERRRIALEAAAHTRSDEIRRLDAAIAENKRAAVSRIESVRGIPDDEIAVRYAGLGF